MTIASLPSAATKRATSPEELLAMPDAVGYELVDGHLLERNMGMESSEIAMRIGILIGIYLQMHQMGRLFANDLGFRCFPDAPSKIRKPDVSFIRSDRLPANYASLGYCPVAPDLAVEVISPGDEAYEVELKVEEYIKVGVPLVWVVYPAIKAVRIHRPDSSPLGRISQLIESDTLDGEDVLPGFNCTVGNFFA